MQRYEIAEDENAGGEPQMFPDAEGNYVLYSDARAEINKAVEANNTAVFECVKAQSALSASEKRVKELEAALRHEIKNCPNCLGRGKYPTSALRHGPAMRDCERCAPARSALEAPHEP